jgi:hypothetical protein
MSTQAPRISLTKTVIDAVWTVSSVGTVSD